MFSRIGETFRSLFSVQRSRAAEEARPVQVIPSSLPDDTPERAVQIESPSEDFRSLIGAYFGDLLSSRPPVEELAQNPLLNRVKRKALRRAVGDSDRTPAQVAEALTQLVPPTLNRDGRRLLQQWSSRHDAPIAGADEATLATLTLAPRLGRQGVARVSSSQAVFQHPQEKQSSIRRPLVIEGFNKSTTITNDDELRRLLAKTKSELLPDEMLDIVEQLRTQPPLDLFERHKKMVKGGPFKGYREVRRGKTGRVLFAIDEDGALHVRVGTHDEIYGTGKYKKDAARTL